MSTTILFSYPLVFRRIRRVDSRYAYLVVQDGFVPLRRREGCLSAIWRYVVYGEWKWNGDSYFEKVVLLDHDEISSFFQTILLLEDSSEEEYDEPIEESFSELGKLWDEKYDELYGRGKKIKGLRVMWSEDKETVQKEEVVAQNVRGKQRTTKVT